MQRKRRSSPLSLDEPPQRRQKSRSPSSSFNSTSRTNSMERPNRSMLDRLGDYRNNSPIRYASDQESYPHPYQQFPSPHQNFSMSNNRPYFNNDNDLESMRIVVRSDQRHPENYEHRFRSVTSSSDVQAEILYSVRHLEERNRDNLRHIDGIRRTVENYQREISKLENLVMETNSEISALKNRISFM